MKLFVSIISLTSEFPTWKHIKLIKNVSLFCHYYLYKDARSDAASGNQEFIIIG